MTAHPDFIPLLWALGATVTLMGCAIATGLKGVRRVHYVCVSSMFLALGIAIYLAESLGRAFTFDAVVETIHLSFAWLTLMGAVPVIRSGIMVARGTGKKDVHRSWVRLFVTLAVTACILGALMMSTGVPKTG